MIQSKHIEMIVALINKEKPAQDNIKKLDLPNNTYCRISSESLLIETYPPEIQKDTRTDNQKISNVKVSEIPGVYRLNWLDSECELSILDKKDRPENFHSTDNLAYIDADTLDLSSLIIRTRQTGDLFQPYGMSQTKTVKKYFIDRKIPQEKRDRIPLFFDKNNLILVLGHQVSEKNKISDSTKRILKFEIKKQTKEKNAIDK